MKFTLHTIKYDQSLIHAFIVEDHMPLLQLQLYTRIVLFYHQI